MSSSAPPETQITAKPPAPHAESSAMPSDVATSESTLREFMDALSSLKLTVWLFALTVFLVLAGTLAQVDKEIWQVVDEYFRTFVAWIDFQLFFPASFFPNRPQVQGGFFFPGGWLLGTLLALNLLAAHGVRFRPQATGRRLAAGSVLIAAGVLITCLVVASGSSAQGLQSASWMSWSTLWTLFLLGLAGLLAGSIFAVRKLDKARKQERRVLMTVASVLGLLLAWLLFGSAGGRLDDSSMRILWQLTKGTAAGLTLLAGCVLVFRRRAGVVVLHSGIGLLMFSELLVGLTAVEGKMHIVEGGTVNFVQDIRRLELAIVDKSPREFDDVVAVPGSMLLSEKIIRHPDLPFDVRVEAFFKNARLRPAQPGERNPATVGLGLQWVAEELRPVSGTDASGKVDQSAAYVTFLDKQDAAPLGTHLVSLAQSTQELPETVTVDDKPYKVYLRFQRTYKPYSLQLVDVRKDDYLGTDTPRNYSSDVHLIDETQNVDRELRIWMNNPLRYAGETFYQSGYFRDPETGLESTTLQVVTNTGWMIPYVACMIVATGLLAHFSVVLLRFLNRRSRDVPEPISGSSADATAVPNQELSPASGRWAWLLPACVVLCMSGWLVSKARLPAQPEKAFKLYEFGTLPVVYQGRAKPIDTLARNALRILSDRQTFIDSSDERQPAVRWLLDVFAKPELAKEHKVFRIEHPEVLDTLGLERRKGFRYGYHEFEGRLDDLAKQAELARSLDATHLTVYQKKILELSNKVGLFDMLIESFTRPSIRTDPEQAAIDLHVVSQKLEFLAQRMPPLSVPPDETRDSWTTYPQAWLQEFRRTKGEGNAASGALASLDALRDAYAAGDVQQFNTEVAQYRKALQAHRPERVDLKRINFEAFFNHFEPFYHASVLYVVVFVLTALSWLGWQRPLSGAAFWLVVLTFLLHSVALVSRIYISGRPPVTNLYSSAVFIGWGCVLLGLVLERIYQIGIGNVISAVAGFATLLIAHFLAGDGDTLAVLQAVLDTQFWLATHVVCITLGYATTYVAGLLGILYILRGALTPTLQPETGRELSRMIYGTLCFATFFSFVGTVLGGLWADDSWGRFWGWDPKENGALIIVLWNALILHARWGRLVRERGLAVLAVAGNIAVSWSWFGVNELGVGLHSYGFTEGVLRSLGLFVLSQLVIIAIGLVPDQWWWSRRRHGDGLEPAA